MGQTEMNTQGHREIERGREEQEEDRWGNRHRYRENHIERTESATDHLVRDRGGSKAAARPHVMTTLHA